MPVISKFYGIVIQMFYNDHAPPHFHALYNEHELIVAISPISMLRGSGPSRVQSLVLEWAALRQEKLIENWERARAGLPLLPVDPLH